MCNPRLFPRLPLKMGQGEMMIPPCQSTNLNLSLNSQQIVKTIRKNPILWKSQPRRINGIETGRRNLQDDEISLLTVGIIDQDESPSTHYDRSNQPKAVVKPQKAPSLETPVPTMDKKAVKMLAFQSQQQELVTLNVGVILFQTTKTTLHADPSSILACITSSCKHGPSDKNFDFFS